MKEKRKFHRTVAVLLVWTLMLSMWDGVLFRPLKTAAADNTICLTNVVLVVRMQGDTDDQFNLKNESTDNWESLKKMYNTATNSLSAYVKEITEDHYEVVSIFPQEKADGTGVNVYTMKQSDYSNPSSMVTELIDAMAGGEIPLDASVKLDHDTSGLVDNLTIIVQGGTILGNSHSFKAEYGAAGTKINGCYVQNYNMFPSDSILGLTGSAQGVIIHEFMHTLGLGDLYYYDPSDSSTPVGVWDIMSSVTYFPQYPLSYSRAQQGWMEDTEVGTIETSGTYTLTAVDEAGGTKLYTITTPLSQNATQTICVEYRRRNAGYSGFEHFSPSWVEGGLIIYRVDQTIADASNRESKNYLYVYRPDPNDMTYDTSGNIYNAALNGTNRTAFGTTNLQETYTANTIYYADGQNTGIAIRDVKISEDAKTLTFRVEYAEYASMDLWDQNNSALLGIVGEPSFCVDSVTGKQYAAAAFYSNAAMTDVYAAVFAYDDENGQWTQMGDRITGVSHMAYPIVTVKNGEIYVSLTGASGEQLIYKQSGSSWNIQASLNSFYPQGVQFYEADGQTFLSLIHSGDEGSQIVLYNVTTGTVLSNDLGSSGGYYGATAVYYNGNHYVLSCEFPGHSPSLKMLEKADGTWKTIKELTTISGTQILDLAVDGGKLYAIEGVSGSGTQPVLLMMNGDSLTEKVLPLTNTYLSLSLEIVNGVVYLGVLDTDADKTILYRIEEDGSLSLVNDALGVANTTLMTDHYGSRIYVAMSNPYGTFSVKWKELKDQGNVDPGTGTGDSGSSNQESIPAKPDTPSGSTTGPSAGQTTDPSTPTLTPSFSISLTIPNGYSGNMAYIDGVPYTGTVSGNTLTITMAEGYKEASSAVMIQTNSRGIPVGMSVWKLSYSGIVYQAELLPGLTDLITYHGFSIRCTGKCGLRFKSGVDHEVKTKLLSGGVDGWKLVEYGTISMNESKMSSSTPLVVNGTSTRRGKAYWVENGKVNDAVFETIGGRDRFTSVLVGIPASGYNTNVAFRGYAILSNGSETMTVYGPIVVRSVYAVAKQVMAAGEFKPGTEAYSFVQNIINTVEER